MLDLSHTVVFPESVVGDSVEVSSGSECTVIGTAVSDSAPEVCPQNDF